LVQVNNASLVPTLLAYAGQRTSVPLLVYINSNVTLASVDDVAPYGIPVNRPLILAGLASVNTSMDFGMVVEQLNASQANSSSVTFQSLVLENLAPGGEATSRASGPFSVLIQNNLFAVYFDRWGAEHGGATIPWPFPCSVRLYNQAVDTYRWCVTMPGHAVVVCQSTLLAAHHLPWHWALVVCCLLVPAGDTSLWIDHLQQHPPGCCADPDTLPAHAPCPLHLWSPCPCEQVGPRARHHQ
jgi:hypothetical protein